MKNVTDFRKTVETGVDPHLLMKGSGRIIVFQVTEILTHNSFLAVTFSIDIQFSVFHMKVPKVSTVVNTLNAYHLSSWAQNLI